MEKEKSKFFNMKSKKKVSKKESIFDEPSAAALSEVEIEELLETVKEATGVIAESSTAEVIEAAPAAVIPTTVAPVVKKAYNIWQDPVSRVYMLDIITYSGEGDNFTMSIESKTLTLSQPMAMYEIKKIFTDKLILKRGGM